MLCRCRVLIVSRSFPLQRTNSLSRALALSLSHTHTHTHTHTRTHTHTCLHELSHRTGTASPSRVFKVPHPDRDRSKRRIVTRRVIVTKRVPRVATQSEPFDESVSAPPSGFDIWASQAPPLFAPIPPPPATRVCASGHHMYASCLMLTIFLPFFFSFFLPKRGHRTHEGERIQRSSYAVDHQRMHGLVLLTFCTCCCPACC